MVHEKKKPFQFDIFDYRCSQKKNFLMEEEVIQA